MAFRIGLISDTHGLLRPEAVAALRGVDHIVHAGDIGDAQILRELAVLAPLTAVRGNNDHGEWAEALPSCVEVSCGGHTLLVVHELAHVPADVAARGISIVITGHSHKPVIRNDANVLYINPGSAGPRRFHLPVSIAELLVNGADIEANLITLKI